MCLFSSLENKHRLEIKTSPFPSGSAHLSVSGNEGSVAFCYSCLTLPPFLILGLLIMFDPVATIVDAVISKLGSASVSALL